MLSGAWWQVSTRRRNRDDAPEHERWDVRTWTMLDNPHFPDAAEHMARVRRVNGWDEDHHQFKQEYLAEWCRSESQMVVPRFTLVPPRPLTRDDVCWMSGDYGFSPDPSAVVVIAKRRNEPARVVFSWKQGRLDDVEWGEEMLKLVERFNPVQFTCDNAGAGSRAIDAFNRKYGHDVGLWIRPADKQHRLIRIQQLNTDFRRGTLLIEEGEDTASKNLLKPARLEPAPGSRLCQSLSVPW